MDKEEVALYQQVMYMLVLSMYLGMVQGVPSSSWRGSDSYHCVGDRDVMVHLFEWTWASVAQECETYLSQHGFCAVQVSPPAEHIVYTNGNVNYPWWQRYQPVSYKVTSRSGTQDQFMNMVTRCNNVGIYIYVDAVINHMTGGGGGVGSAGTDWNGDQLDYPGVPYSRQDFHDNKTCTTEDLNIQNYGDQKQVRMCRLLALNDLALEKDYVSSKVVQYLNRLISWGVAGFRVDATKHMWPRELANIYGQLNHLNTTWFPSNTRPFIYQEVIDLGGDASTTAEYTPLGRVTEFKYGKHLGDIIRKNGGQRLAYLKNFGEGWGFTEGISAVSFIDNHDNQRGHGAGGYGSILTFFDSNMYKMANAFLLAWPYGYVRLMSSYHWPRHLVNGKDINDWVGPPSDENGKTKEAPCFLNGWVCEHRWRQISNMVRFHNMVVGTPVGRWWDNGYHGIAFARGNMGYLIINNERFPLNRYFNTGLPTGEYCDVISCDNNKPPCGNSGGLCRGRIYINKDGWAKITVPSGQDSIIAIHV